MKWNERFTRIALIFLFTVLGFAVMGYHPGLEDDGIYLPAIKADLNPALYPNNAGFFRLQVQATVFDRWMACFIRVTHIAVPWAELLWQLASLFAVLWACHGIARRLFREPRAQWGAVAMVGAMFTLPVSGTALFLMDQHLHPRNVATALILLAVAQIMNNQRWYAAALLVLAFVMHPIMAAMGISFCIFLAAALSETVPVRLRALRSRTAAAVPLAWIIEPANAGWRKALNVHTYYDLYKWHWYEWLGAVAPLALFWLLWRMARRHNQPLLARFALAVFMYGAFQQIVAFAMLSSPALIRLTPFQPMRYLQLVYFFMALVAGALLGSFALKSQVWRWGLFLLVVNSGMLFAQCEEFNASPHIEWPGRQPSNPWLEAFAWIRQNTPVDAYFALDPHYWAAPGEDYHGFRALAERSQLADAMKDAAAVTQVPELGPEWERQVAAEQGWSTFGLADFERLKRDFGVDWVLVALPQSTGLDCRWHNRELAVCAIP